MNIYADIKNDIVKKFAHKNQFSRDDLYEFLETKYFPDLKETTFRWRVYELKKRKIITSIRRGLFKIVEKELIFKPNITDETTKIKSLLIEKYGEISYCVWNSRWFNYFSRHQSSSNISFWEIERDLLKSVFYLFVDYEIENVFLEPDKRTYETYIINKPEVIIVKPLVTKAPTQNLGDVHTSNIEKLIVDLIVDQKYLLAYQGNEQISILKNIIAEYEINYSLLVNYSKRRKSINKVRSILVNECDINGNLLL